MNEKNLPMKGETWKPFGMLEDLRTEFERLWEKPMMPFRSRRFEMADTQTYMPRLDVYEKDNELIVKADLPGMKKEDVHVALEDGALVLKGERKEEKEIKEEGYYRSECLYGSFYRSLPLGFDVAPDKVTAKFADGVLEVRMPKPAQEKPAPAEIAIH